MKSKDSTPPLLLVTSYNKINTNNLTNKLFPLVCSAINYTLGSTNPTSVLFLTHCSTEADFIHISYLEELDYATILLNIHIRYRYPLSERYKLILHKSQELFHLIHIIYSWKTWGSKIFLIITTIKKQPNRQIIKVITETLTAIVQRSYKAFFSCH